MTLNNKQHSSLSLSLSLSLSIYIYIYVLRFWTLILHMKELYPMILLSSFCIPWPTGAFWHCFASSTVVYLQHFCSIGQLYKVSSLQWKLTHLFTALFQLWCDIWSSKPSVMQADDSDEIVLCVSVEQAIIQHNIVQFLFKRWYHVSFVKSFIHAQYLRRKTPSNQFFQRYLIMLGQSYWELFAFLIINKNIVILIMFQ